jgi:hypothetical protein
MSATVVRSETAVLLKNFVQRNIDTESSSQEYF